MSSFEWEALLIREYNDGLEPEEEIAWIPGWQNSVQFLDVAMISQRTFDLRHRNSGESQ